MSEQTSEYIVHYMKGYGRAEPIRFLLCHAGIPFTDAYYSYPEMDGLRATGKLEFGQVPVLEKDGKCKAQTIATLRYLAKEHGYYSEDAYEAFLIDSAADAVGDVFTGYFSAAFAPEEVKQELFSNFLQNTCPRLFSAFEKRLEGNQSGFFVGHKITMADFMMGSLIFSIFLNEACPVQLPILEVAKNYPKLMAYSEGLREHLKARLSDRLVSPW